MTDGLTPAIANLLEPARYSDKREREDDRRRERGNERARETGSQASRVKEKT